MTATRELKSVARDGKMVVWDSIIRITLVLTGCGAALGAGLGILTHVSPMFGAIVGGLLGLAIAVAVDWTFWRDRFFPEQGFYALIVHKWIDASPDAATRQSRETLVAEQGMKGALKLIEPSFVRNIRGQAALKEAMRQRGNTVLRARNAGMPFQEAPLFSNNGLQVGAGGVDAYGDAIGSSWNHDRMVGINPNTDGFSSSGTYQPPI